MVFVALFVGASSGDYLHNESLGRAGYNPCRASDRHAAVDELRTLPRALVFLEDGYADEYVYHAGNLFLLSDV